MSTPNANDRTYSIGQVVRMLQAEFPDLTVSKVRFLESAGLIAPRRKESGYRLFTEADVKRLKSILVLQRDHFLPLHVIKEKLDSGESVAYEVEAVARTEGVAHEEKTREELMREFSITPEFLDDLERFDLVSPRQVNGNHMYSADDVTVVALAQQLSAFGLQPRHLKIYENFVGKEALSFEQILFPMARQKGDEARENAKKTFDSLLRLATALRTALLRKTLRKRFPDIDF